MGGELIWLFTSKQLDKLLELDGLDDVLLLLLLLLVTIKFVPFKALPNVCFNRSIFWFNNRIESLLGAITELVDDDVLDDDVDVVEDPVDVGLVVPDDVFSVNEE